MTKILLIILLAGCRPSHPVTPGGSADRVAISQLLPPMNGDSLKITLVEVTYGPGASSPSHSHPCPVIGYVISGALRTRSAGEPEATYRAGESFYEKPNSVHLVSGNASMKDSVTFLAYFVCDRQATLSVPTAVQ
jgi:quercetin dioxygenase-like cupin family protein